MVVPKPTHRVALLLKQHPTGFFFFTTASVNETLQSFPLKLLLTSFLSLATIVLLVCSAVVYLNIMFYWGENIWWDYSSDYQSADSYLGHITSCPVPLRIDTFKQTSVPSEQPLGTDYTLLLRHLIFFGV